MLVYLDSCCIQRPLDDRTQLRIAVEAECVLGLLALAESRTLDLVSSEALLFEVGNNTNIFRRSHALEVLGQAGRFVEVSATVEKRAEALESCGLGPLDALHLACAEVAHADRFCTCDDDLVRKASGISDLGVRVVTSVELVKELEQ